MNSKINIPFNVIQRVNMSLRISREIPRSQLSHLKVIDLDQYSLLTCDADGREFKSRTDVSSNHAVTDFFFQIQYVSSW